MFSTGFIKKELPDGGYTYEYRPLEYEVRKRREEEDRRRQGEIVEDKPRRRIKKVEVVKRKKDIKDSK